MTNTVEKKQEIALHRDLVQYYEVRYGHEYAQIYHSHWNRILTGFLPGRRDLRVLDEGCGTGALLKELCQDYDGALGTDISLDMLRARGHRSPVLAADLENLPVASGSFDAAIFRGSLHHVPNPSAALAETYRILKPGGILVLSEPCDDSLVLWLPRRYMVPRLERFSPTHRAFKGKELIDLVKGAGFEVVAKHRFGFFAFPLCGLSDHLPLMRYLPFSLKLAKALIYLDQALGVLPVVKSQSWHIILSAESIKA